MRPPVPEVSMPRSRKSSFEQHRVDPRTAAPATFFLARGHAQHSEEDEKTEEEREEGVFEQSRFSRDSMYGVQSLEDTMHAASFPTGDRPSDDHLNINIPDSNNGEDAERPQLARRRSTLKQLGNLRTDTSLQPPSDRASSRPLTPLNLDDPLSLPSSPKSISNQSMKHLDDISITDELSSQAVGSEEEDNGVYEAQIPTGFDCTSQLIMPSIRMPSRRPFTGRGKAMGRFKVLVAGACGSGKTSLIKSIVQVCDDIVHVDSFPSPASWKNLSRSNTQTSPAIASEIYASTKPYPPWWSDLEDSRVLRRRKSNGDVVLERNICFVDTLPNSLSRVGQTDAIVHYMQQQLLRATTAVDSSKADFQNLLAGNGGAQVDAVLYLISEDTLATDIECIGKLCEWTNVIPLIGKSDLMTPRQVSALKSSFREKAEAASIKVFLFGNATGADKPAFDLPFAVSSAKTDDDEIMDASTLMSPDYVHPLMPSELSLLIQKMFDHDNMAWIRHSAARKLVQQRHDQPQHWEIAPRPSSPFGGQSAMSRSAFSVLSASSVDGVTSLPSGRYPSYTMARISDYTRHEEKIAQVQLAKWASELQRSLQNERERYATLARGERAVWLTERLGECVVDGTLVPITQTPGFGGLRIPTDKAGGGLLVRTPDGQKVEYRIANLSRHDPLGLVWWSEDLQRRGWAIVQIVGSLGVVGGLAIWLAKAWGLPSRSLSEWRFEWCGTCE
ncbi:uncharacterized protein ACLA_000980 [Aspergillus clavatus NRRL 1]|uniref:Septin-type G domain-containing protein n=1 Tax=Aspergillus clavatus (strain ATCC 1007 / CBS 513.65 / DSM 816 / NCTC 3887 / NRRL 1 / QM 1276 / 107) TaxID=344612 RepID=A1C4R9_ASPCL|nr:uncharacterized protein ACLA_000980 [Aspergillus clavatus NRRL 1]EAW14687.1 conserved hypothetical protein [Aspergillus clavatus NRRL 1]